MYLILNFTKFKEHCEKHDGNLILLFHFADFYPLL